MGLPVLAGGTVFLFLFTLQLRGRFVCPTALLSSRVRKDVENNVPRNPRCAYRTPGMIQYCNTAPQRTYCYGLACTYWRQRQCFCFYTLELRGRFVQLPYAVYHGDVEDNVQQFLRTSFFGTTVSRI